MVEISHLGLRRTRKDAGVRRSPRATPAIAAVAYAINLDSPAEVDEFLELAVRPAGGSLGLRSPPIGVVYNGYFADPTASLGGGHNPTGPPDPRAAHPA